MLFYRLFLTFPFACKKDSDKQNQTQNFTAGLYVTAKSGLKLREQADRNGKVVVLIPCGSEVKFIEEKGEPVSISGSSGKWTKIQWKEHSGWAFGGFLSKTKPPDNVIHLSDLKCGKIISKSEKFCRPAEMEKIKKMNYQQAKEYCGQSGLPSKTDFMTADYKYQGGFWTSDEDGERVKIFTIEVSGDGGGGFPEMTSDKSPDIYTVCK